MNFNKEEFKIFKLLDEGTANPVVNRITLQFYKILNSGCIELAEDKINKIKKVLFECMEKLLKAEVFKKNYDELEEKTINKFSNGKGIDFQKNAIFYDNPINNLKRYFEDFLINCVISIRKIVKISEIILEKKINGPGELRSNLEKIFANDTDIIKMFDEDSQWILELYKLRELVEHDELEIEGFLINKLNYDKVSITAPKILLNKVFVRKYMDITFEDCFTFCEDIIFLLLKKKCSFSADLILLPENIRENYRNFKYTLFLKT